VHFGVDFSIKGVECGDWVYLPYLLFMASYYVFCLTEMQIVSEFFFKFHAEIRMARSGARTAKVERGARIFLPRRTRSYTEARRGSADCESLARGELIANGSCYRFFG